MLAEAIDTHSTSPQALIDSIASGDKASEQKLVNSYWRGLLFVLNRRAQNLDLAQDIAQDTFIVVIAKVRNREIENPNALAAFIRQTGINLLIAHYRKEQRRQTECEDSIDVNFADHQQSTADQLNQKQLAELVQQVMQELPTERDRDLLRAYFVHGKSKAQLCQEYELKPEHFDRVLFRARNRLKQILQVKLSIDLKKVSLSHLLVIPIIVTLFNSADEQSFNHAFFVTSVRDPLTYAHYANNNGWEAKRLEIEQYQRGVTK